MYGPFEYELGEETKAIQKKVWGAIDLATAETSRQIRLGMEAAYEAGFKAGQAQR